MAGTTSPGSAPRAEGGAASAADEPVRFYRDGRVARLELNRPAAGNAVDPALYAALCRHLEALQQEAAAEAGGGGDTGGGTGGGTGGAEAATVLVLSGAGADFCVGRDRTPPAGQPTALTVREGLRRIVRLNRLVAGLPLITVAAVQGRAEGVGAGLVMHCDLAVASADATLAFPEMRHNLPPTVVLSYLGRHLPPKRLMELVALGGAVDAATAERWGLVNRVVPRDGLRAAADALAAQVAGYSPLAVRTMKSFVLQARGLGEADAYELGVNVLANVTAGGDIGMYDRK